MTEPLVSICIPAYNSVQFIAETVDSALAQTYPNVEVVIVDDGSTDGTSDLLDRYAGRIVLHRQKNQGLAAARNKAFELSKGDYVAWLDGDDIVMPERVALELAVLRRNPGMAVVASDFTAFDAHGWEERSHAAAYYSAIAKRGLGALFPERAALSTRELGLPSSLPDTVTVYEGLVHETLVYGNCLHPPTVMMTRKAALAAGRLEQRFGNDIDWEYLLRLTRSGTAAFIDLPLLRYRYSDHQLSSDKNMPKIARSLVTVLEHLVATEPHRTNDPAFRRRMAEAHLAAADAFADKERGTAARHLAQSLRAGGLVNPGAAARAAAKLLLPRAALGAVRALRGRRPPPS